MINNLRQSKKLNADKHIHVDHYDVYSIRKQRGSILAYSFCLFTLLIEFKTNFLVSYKVIIMLIYSI